MRRRPVRTSAWVLVGCLAVIFGIAMGAAWAQNPAKTKDQLTGNNAVKAGDVPPVPTKPQRERPIQMDVNMVLVNVTVTDTMNRLVTGLEREHFQVYEEKD